MSGHKEQSSGGNDLQASVCWQVIRKRYGIILFGLVFVFLAATVITDLIPEEYKASVLLEVNNVGQTKSPFGGELTLGEQPFSSQNYIQTLLEAMTSVKVLEQVVRRLDLAREFNLPHESMAIARVRGMIRAEARRGTDFIEISVTDLKRQRAADIANVVASSYLQVRKDLINRQNQQALAVLDKQLREQEERVRQAGLRLDKLMKESESAGEGHACDIITRCGPSIFDLENKVEALRAQVNALQGLEGDALIRKMAMMGFKEPGIAEDVRESLELQFQQAEKELQLVKSRNAHKESDGFIENRLRSVACQQARNDCETQRDILKELRVVSLAQCLELSNMPRMPLVIWADAHPADCPSSPNKPLNLILGYLPLFAYND